VRLVACGSGQADGAAARLSRELGVDVKAPTDTVWIHPDGTLTVGPTPDAPSGGWSRTSPDGASEVVEGSARVGEDGLRRADEAVAAGTRQERLDELARDPDHGGGITPGTRREAEVALTLEETGRLKPTVRRPGANESGDFVDGDGIQWDSKAPRSRDLLQADIRQRAIDSGRAPPKLDPSRPMAGEFDLNKELASIVGEIASKENVILDCGMLNAVDRAALETAVRDAGLAPHVIFFP
jgi:hypothetical protein